MNDNQVTNSVDGVAIIGMAGRFPRARNIAEFWRNVRDGIECVSHFTAAELEISDGAALARNPDYVKARSTIEDADLFDAAFFGILPSEAALIDPQQRVFLESCWEALEDAGYDPYTYTGAVAVYAGCSANTYFLRNLCVDPGFIEEYTNAYQVGHYPTLLGTNHDFLATRVSYKLNLTGPSFTIQCGCSTSLVAVCQACQGLLSFQSDMALAGGVSITFPQKRGYFYQDGGMGSKDGHCRTFDADAQGTVFGSGSGVVLLKRLEDALAEGDHIYAVIKGFAVNNDGSSKVGYTAPSVEGQANVVAMAHAMAGVDPESVTYIEAHGTATPLGDPIEFTALGRAFRAGTKAKGFCALGTAKMNVGHLDIASGVTGLINVAQALVHEQLPPSIHFKSPNPKIDLTNSPFYVNTRLSAWKRGKSPRRAGVSAFGVGGTNAHVVLEEAPQATRPKPQLGGHLLVLSARTETALEAATENLAGHLRAHPESDLASVAYTLQAGRHAFGSRRSVACSDLADAIVALESRDPKRVITRVHEGRAAPVVFMFPGQGSQTLKMGAGLYHAENQFRSDVDTCSEILKAHLGLDLRESLYSDGSEAGEAAGGLIETRLAQAALFVIEYALARMWMRWGVRPEAMIGHSVGEIVAACLAGVLSLEHTLAVIAERGRLMQQLPAGAMLSVRLGEQDVMPLLHDGLCLAASNSPVLSVVSGPETAINLLQGELEQRGVSARRLSAAHAFHSSMMDPIIAPFTAFLERIRLSEPSIPFISGVTGTWITAREATDPAYWARHFREPVRFSAGIEQLRSSPERLFLEAGPGTTLCTLVRQHREGSSAAIAVPSLPNVADSQSDSRSIWDAAGRLWLHGVTPLWAEMHGRAAKRCSLPTYPFERKRYWIDQARRTTQSTSAVEGQGSAVACAPATTTPVEKVMTEQRTTPTTAPNRTDRIRAALIEIFEDLSGISLAESDSAATFLEMGFDSLFLTQVTQALQAKFELKITFRQLLDQESTLEALSAFVDAKLPAGAFPGAQVSAPAVADTRPSQLAELDGPLARSSTASTITTVPAVPLGSSTIEAIVREQLQAMSQLMSRQLDVLRATGGVADSVAPALPISVSPQSAVTQLQDAPPTRPALSASGSGIALSTEAAKEFKPFGPYKPVQKGPVGDMTERQSHYLDALIKRYTARTARSKEYTQNHRRVLADPRVAAGFRSQWKEMVYPIVTSRSKGPRLWDLDGNEYVDILNGFGPIMFGHAPKFITDAVERQLKDGYEIGPQAPLAGEVANLVCELTGMERATFCNTGTEAVMAAVRVARTVTARNKIVLFAGAYHGTVDEVLVKGIRKGGAPHSLPIAPGIPREKVENVTVLDYGTPESLEYIRTHANELAAVLVEPVQSRHGSLQPVEFLREIRRITQAAGAALIFDEVVTGFRVHPGGVQAVFGIRADMATYGKVIGGGLPIGILAGAARFMDALDGGMWQYGDDSFPEVGVTFFAGTFVRHPLALAAAHAVLIHLKEQGPGLQRTLNEKTSNLVVPLNGYFKERGVTAHIEHFGSIFYFSFPADERFGSLIYYHLREKGVHIQEGFPSFLTTAHTDADIDHVARAFRESIAEMQAGGVLPEPPGHVGEMLIGSQPGALTSNAGPIAEAPVTEAQLEVWLSARLSDEANCAFNESFTLRMHGVLDHAALAKAIQQIVDRHDALRSTFDPTRNCIRFLDRVQIAVPLVDLCSFSHLEITARVAKLIGEDASVPFDLVAGPLCRCMLVKLEQDHHALIFTTHHLVCDGWSTNVLLDELSRLYTSNCTGVGCDLPQPLQFSRHALAQAEWVRSSEREAVAAWWAEQFAAQVSPLELPVDRPRGSLKSYAGDTARFTISSDRYQAIKRFGAKQGCTLFATLLAGFKVLLHRLSGQSDIVVGIPAAGQSLLDGEVLIGHCVNFLPLRTSFADDPQVSGLLKRVKSIVLDAYEHQNYTYGSLVRKLALPRDPSRLPLVEVQFNLERVGPGLAFPALKVEVDPNPKSFVNFDLFLNIVESDFGLAIDCDYNRDLFDRQTVDRWLHHYQTLLEEMVASPVQPVSALSLLDNAERRRLLVEWNQTRVEYPSDKCIHELFEEQAARTPESYAAVFNDQQLCYAELDAASNRLAHYLKNMGVGPGTTVGICLDRSLEMLVALLAVLKAGGAYVPLDPYYPRERISAVIEDSTPVLILTSEDIASRLGSVPCGVICLDQARAAILQESSRKPDTNVSPRNLAYLIFTSGSTGRPKGVEITHRSVVNLLSSMANQPGLNPQDTLLAVTTLSFDIAVLELFLPLVVGARVVIAGREDVTDGNRLLALLTASGATAMQATPATWRLLIEAGWNGRPQIKVLCGGEALSRDLADALLARSASVWNMYGPTETTIWSATSRVEPGPQIVTVGPPIANTQFFVLDSSGRPAPIGVPGELLIGGDGVARGYWKQPALSAEKFIRSPFADDPTSVLYKTGDLVRYLPNGSLEFLGRLDSQLKVRGFRIEATEVESVITKFPGVRECVVVAREDSPGDNRLVAYLVAEGSIPATGELRRFIAAKLPDYMVPTSFVSLELLPRTPNGKIDRRRLPVPGLANARHTPEFVAARNPRERTLAEICATVLHLDRVSVDDSLFDLGADSVHLFQVVARANDAGIPLTPTQILAGRSIRAITAELDRSEVEKSDRDVPELVPVSRDRYRTQRSALGVAELSDGRGQSRWHTR
jgi:amino acid adenylation domain-containing protein